jgi:DNA modification methylase
MTKHLKPYYSTHLGKAYLGDSLDIMQELNEGSINLAVTSPPFALTFKKEYGNVHSDDYVAWFLKYAREVRRLLSDDGSFVVDIGGAWQKGKPVRSLYHYELVLALCKEVGFYLAQDFFWYRPAALPAPAEWVTVRRIRVKDAVNYVFWFSKTEWPKADNRRVLTAYSRDMLRLLEKGYKAKVRPSGHNITKKWNRNQGGAIPPNLIKAASPVDALEEPENVIEVGNNDSNGYYLKACKENGLKPHPARYPRALPEFFIKFLSDVGDTVLDPFAGSNVTGEAAEYLQRKWISIEANKDYLDGSKFRFVEPELFQVARQ